MKKFNDFRELLIVTFLRERVEGSTEAEIVSVLSNIVSIAKVLDIVADFTNTDDHFKYECMISFHAATGDLELFEAALRRAIEAALPNENDIFRVACQVIYSHNGCKVKDQRAKIQHAFDEVLNRNLSEFQVNSLKEKLISRKVYFDTTF